MLADRLVLTLINRRQVDPEQFHFRDGGAVEMSEAARKTVVGSWQERKQEETTHPLLGISTRTGLLIFAQARILARAIRGELSEYVPCVPR